MALFDINDVIMRLGGDEFVILLKDISHAAIMKKAGKLIREVQKLKFSGTTLIVALLQNPDGTSLPDCLLFQDFAKMWRKC